MVLAMVREAMVQARGRTDMVVVHIGRHLGVDIENLADLVYTTFSLAHMQLFCHTYLTYLADYDIMTGKYRAVV